MNALNVAKYVITKCYENGAPVSNLKLQKMLYFLYGWFFAEFNKSLFKDDFVAWKLGPVVLDVYFEYSKYIANPICEKHNDVELYLNNDERDFIDDKIKLLNQKSARVLVDESHKTSPWKKTYNDGAGKGNIISALKINSYFSGANEI